MLALDTTQKITQTYLQDLANDPVMSAEEFTQLIPLAKAGDTEAFKRIVQGNLRFVVQVAGDYRRTSLPFGDLIAEGNLGLIKAVERFDPELGYQFSTYAIWWIRNMIQRAIRQNAHLYRLPHNRLDDLARIQRSAERLSQERGYTVSSEEAARELGMSNRRSGLALASRQASISLDRSPVEDTDRPLHHVVADDTPLQDEQIIQEQIRSRLHSALKHLNARDAEIIDLTFGLNDEPRTLTEVGRKFGISKERVRQIRNRGMDQIKTMLLGQENGRAAHL